MAGVITWNRLRELAAFRAENGLAISLYIGFDPGTAGTIPSVTTKLNSLLDEAQKSALAGRGELAHDEKLGLQSDFERIRDFLTNDFDRAGAQGLAIFAAGLDAFWNVNTLSEAVPDRVCVAPDFYLRPLVPLLGRGEGAIVAVIDRERGLLFKLTNGRLEPLSDLSEEQPGRHDQGGWSQARFQRGIQKEADDHVKHAAEVLFRRFRRTPFDKLLIGCPEEHCREVEKRLHPYLQERIVGRIDVDVENTTPDQVLEAASTAMEDEDTRRERDALDRLEEGLGTGGRAAAGLDDVLGALNERRVEILMFEQGLNAPGVACPNCGWVRSEGSSCPVDETPLEQREDIIETAVQLAITQSAEVIPIHHHDDLDGRGSIATVLRF